MKKQVQKGFTLIELMIVVAIIGILASIALPAYQDYTKRAHVSEGLSLASGAKTAVAEYYSTNAAWPSNNTDAGLASASDISGTAVTEVAVSTGGVIKAKFNAKVEADKVLALKPTDNGGAIQWDCKPSAGTTVNAKYLPSKCR